MREHSRCGATNDSSSMGAALGRKPDGRSVVQTTDRIVASHFGKSAPKLNEQSHEPRPLRCLTEASFVAWAGLARLCRATSYITIAPATETFSEGTLPAMGIETR